jgi:hypothetical protein
MINQIRKSLAMPGILAALLFLVGISTQNVLAQEFTPNGASQFAPGIVDSDTASNISPGAAEKGIEQHGRLPGGGCLAAVISPGHLFKLGPTTTDTSP